MVYMGSKNRLADKIIPVIQKLIDENEIDCYVEPFVGGANVIDKIKCKEKYGFDLSYTLIDLLKKGQTAPEEIPNDGSREWWDKAKTNYRSYQGKPNNEMESWYIGAIQFFSSMSAGGFPRGYAKPSATRNYYKEHYSNFMKQCQNPEFKNIIFAQSKFEDCLDKIENLSSKKVLIYCDPPYEGTKPYGYAFETKFNHKVYWDWVREQSKDKIVICSEQNFPEDFEVIWTKDIVRTTNKTNDFKAVEKLGRYNII